MNMPGDVRETITAALVDVQAWADTLGYKPEDVALVILALAWLDAQPAMPEPHWVPVEPQSMIPNALSTTRAGVAIGKDGYIIVADEDGSSMMQLPPDVRICRLVEPGEKAGE